MENKYLKINTENIILLLGSASILIGFILLSIKQDTIRLFFLFLLFAFLGFFMVGSVILYRQLRNQLSKKEVVKIRCPQCKSLNEEDAKFCKSCSKEIG